MVVASERRVPNTQSGFFSKKHAHADREKEQGVVAMGPGTLDPEPVMSWDLRQPVLCRLLPRHERSPTLRGGKVTPCMVHAPPKSALHNDATPSRTTVFHAKMCRTVSRRFLSKSPDACARTTARAQACNVKCPNTAQ